MSLLISMWSEIESMHFCDFLSQMYPTKKANVENIESIFNLTVNAKYQHEIWSDTSIYSFRDIGCK